MEVGLRDAKARLSELVAAARNGERVIITKHGHPQSNSCAANAAAASTSRSWRRLAGVWELRTRRRKRPRRCTRPFRIRRSAIGCWGSIPRNRRLPVRVLLDTTYLYRFMEAPFAFSSADDRFFAAPDTRLFVSVVSIWEMRLKYNARHPSGVRKSRFDPNDAVAALEESGRDVPADDPPACRTGARNAARSQGSVRRTAARPGPGRRTEIAHRRPATRRPSAGAHTRGIRIAEFSVPGGRRPIVRAGSACLPAPPACPTGRCGP